jgi:TolB-like protein
LQPRRQLLADGKRITLGKRALDILSVLADANGGIVTKDELLTAVWPGVVVEENALQVHVVALRKALGPEADRLKTIRGIGYQLLADGVAVGASGQSGQTDESGGKRTPANPGPARILVLPFSNMSGDPEQEYFADGITDDVITDLSKVSALTVVSRSSALSLKGRDVDLDAVVRQLEVTHILEGSVRKSANRVRVTAQLIDSRTKNHLWGERFDRDFGDIFALQDELSEAMVRALRVKLLTSEKIAIEARGTRNAEAYDYYIRARSLRASILPENVRRAIENYRQALALDPEFAMGWAGLASAMVLLQSYFPATDDASLREMDYAMARADELAPELPAMIASRAQRCLFERDWQGAEVCIEECRRREATDWTVFSHLLLALGRAQEAAEQQFGVTRADPLSIGASWGLQYHLDCARRFDEAEAEYEKSKDFPGSRLPLDLLALNRMMARGRLAEVRKQLVLVADDTDRLPFALELADVLEEPSKALAILRSALSEAGGQSALRVDAIAHFAAFLGDDDLAIEALGYIVDVGGTLVIDLWHPNFGRVRLDSRFKDLVRRTGLADHWRRTGNWGDFARPLNDDDFELIA